MRHLNILPLCLPQIQIEPMHQIRRGHTHLQHRQLPPYTTSCPLTEGREELLCLLSAC